MGFFDFIRGKQAPQQTQSLFETISNGIKGVISGRNTDPLNEYHGWVFACTKKIAEEVASIELKLVRKSDGEHVTSHPVLDVLESVNPYMTFHDLVEATQSYIELEGNAFWLLLRTGSRIDGILPIRPDFVEVVQDEGRLVGGYIYRVDGKTVKIPRESMVHFRTFNPKNFFRGVGTVAAATQAIQSDNFANSWNIEFFKNSARPDVVLQYEGNLNERDKTELINKWNDQHKGVEKSHRAAVAAGGLKIIPLGYSQKDMDLVNMSGSNRDKILAMFGTPKEVFGIFDGTANRATADMAEYVFMKHTIKPKMTKITDTLNELFLGLFPNTENLKFVFTNPVPTDRAAETLEIESAIKNDYMTQNEARARRNLPPVEGGDVLYIPVGKVGIGEVVPQKSVKAEVIDVESNNSPFSGIAKAITLQMKSLIDSADFEKKGAKWQGEQVKRAQKPEEKLTDALSAYFSTLKTSVLKEFDAKLKEKTFKLKIPDLMDLDEEAKKLIEEMEPVLLRVVGLEVESALDLIDIAEGIREAQERVKEAFKRPLEKFAGLITEETSNKIRETIAEGIKNGDAMTDIRKKIEALSSFDSSRAAVIARTEIARAQNFASVQAWKDSGVVEKKVWYTAEDERVEKACNDLHGKEFGISDKIIKTDIGWIKEPPLHPNCRCTLIPVVSERKAAHVHVEDDDIDSDIAELEKVNKMLEQEYD